MTSRIPLSAGVSAFVAVTVPYYGTGKSVIDAINGGDYFGAGQAALYNYTGIVVEQGTGGLPPHGQGGFSFDIQTLNPFCMTSAPALKAFFWTKMITKITRKVLGNPLTRIPFIKDYLSWS